MRGNAVGFCALNYRVSRFDLKLPLLESTLPSNERHLDRAIQSVLDLNGRVGVIGLAFKENTDDLREVGKCGCAIRTSACIALYGALAGKGAASGRPVVNLVGG